MRRASRPGRSERVRRSGGWLLPIGLLLAPAAAAGDREDELDRWVPSFAVTPFAFLTQGAKGAVTSGDVLGPPLPPFDDGCDVTDPMTGETTPNGDLCAGSEAYSGRKLTLDTTSRDTGVAPMVEGSLELMTPRLISTAPFPRLFVHADLSAAFGSERKLAGERDPASLSSPELRPTLNDIPERAVGGQGSRSNSQLGRLVLSAGAGVAFTTQLWQRTVRLKPSFEYLRQEVDLEGRLHRAVKERAPADSRGTLDDFRLIRLRATDSETQHALGAGLEVEVDSGRLGPFALSVFALGRGYRFLGDLDYTLSDTNEFGETARWDFEFDPWGWRAGLGIRFRWLPE